MDLVPVAVQEQRGKQVVIIGKLFRDVLQRESFGPALRPAVVYLFSFHTMYPTKTNERKQPSIRPMASNVVIWLRPSTMR